MRQEVRKAKTYRSMLFVPAHKLDWMRRAPRFEADALIFDLEDSVPVDGKDAARQAVTTVLDEFADAPFGKFVRVNAWRTGHLLADVSAIVRPGLTGVMLPKTEEPSDVTGLDLLISELELERSLPPEGIEIMPLTETARGMFNHYEICMCSERIRRSGGAGGLPPGGDGTRALGLRLTEDMGIEALFSTGRGNLEARAAGITKVMGGMTSKIDDLDLVRRLAERSKVLGASGALAIHPSHIAILNEVFSPSKEEIAEAHEIIDAMSAAIARGDAAVRLGSGMVDYAHVRTSIDLLREAQEFGLDAGEIPDMAIPSFDD